MIEYLRDNALRLAFLTQQHIELVLLAVSISTLIAVTLALATEHAPQVREVLLSVAATVLTMPSFALFALMVPLFGLGVWPSIVVLSLYGVFPIFRNAVTGLRGVDAAVLDAAKGLGMSDRRRMWRVQIPLAMPVIVNGIRTATIMLVATAAIAAAVRGPGLGEPIFRGLARIGGANALEEVLAGLIGIVLVALVLDLFFLLVRKITTPRGIDG